MTIDCDNEYFRTKGTIWEGKNLYELYGEAYTPWDWQPKLKEIAEEFGLAFVFCSLNSSSVDFLEQMGVPAYKVASFELVDLQLLQKIARTGKPVIMSTGMATLGEIDEAVQTASARPRATHTTGSAKMHERISGVAGKCERARNSSFGGSI